MRLPTFSTRRLSTLSNPLAIHTTNPRIAAINQHHIANGPAVEQAQPHNSAPQLAPAHLKALNHYSRYRPTALTMRQLLDFGQRDGTPESSYMFLRKELIIRMANIMQEFSLLPPVLLNTPSATMVGGWYVRSFGDFLDYESLPWSGETAKRFSNTLRTILRRHATVVEAMAEAMLEMSNGDSSGLMPRNGSRIGMGIDAASQRSIQYFLDRFYLNRISIRMLQHQHLSLFEDGPLPSCRVATENSCTTHVGYIDPHCNVSEIIVDAYDNARLLCEQHYSHSPRLELECLNTRAPSASSFERHAINVAVVPLHLYYIMFELIKNAMRATVEHHARLGEEGEELPPVAVKVVLGDENLTISVSDQGGGVPQSRLEHLFHYMYSTAPKPPRKNDTGPSRSGLEQTPFAGYGYGLPISRLYARYFLGDLTLSSMDGWGTTASVYLKAYPDEASELLPVFGGTSKSLITMGRKAPDWCYQEAPPRKTNGSEQQAVE